MVEYVLSFGVVCASNIAQRFSELILALAELELRDLIEEEGEAPSRMCFKTWLQRRKVIQDPRQVRLHTLKMYTDDAAQAAASADEFILLLRAFHRATTKLNLRMAIAAKRHLGAGVLWLGAGFLAAIGVLFIPRGKVLRARLALRSLAMGELTSQQVRALNGLLEHLKGLLFGSRRWMFGLWELVDHRDPAAIVQEL